MKFFITGFLGEKVPAVNGRWNEWLGSIDRAFRKARIPSIFLAGGDVDWAGTVVHNFGDTVAENREIAN